MAKTAGWVMGRLPVIVALSVGALVWPAPLAAQQSKPIKHVAVLTGGSGPDSSSRVSVFLKALAEIGWTDGQNVSVDVRHGGGNPDVIRKYAAELAVQSPDVVMTVGGTATGLLLRETRKVPIVFTIVPDPVGSGFVDNLAHPGGNATGFLQFEYGLSAKWVELLREIGPKLVRAAVLRDASLPAGIGQYAVIQSVAPQIGIEVKPVNVKDPVEIERDIAAFARASDSGLIVASSTSALVNRDLIIKLAAHHRLPAVYAQREFATAGGLLSYSADFAAQFRSAAGYVDRILKGEKPSNLPVQAPTKYELVINAKTARQAGIDIPVTLLARADEVID